MNAFFEDLRNLTSHFDPDAGTLRDPTEIPFLIDEIVAYLEEFKK